MKGLKRIPPCGNIQIHTH